MPSNYPESFARTLTGDIDYSKWDTLSYSNPERDALEEEQGKILVEEEEELYDIEAEPLDYDALDDWLQGEDEKKKTRKKTPMRMTAVVAEDTAFTDAGDHNQEIFLHRLVESKMEIQRTIQSTAERLGTKGDSITKLEDVRASCSQQMAIYQQMVAVIDTGQLHKEGGKPTTLPTHQPMEIRPPEWLSNNESGRVINDVTVLFRGFQRGVFVRGGDLNNWGGRAHWLQ